MPKQQPSDIDKLNPDADLIALCQKGDKKAFSELVERYRTRVASIAYQVLGNYEDAGDVAQEVFIKLYKGISGFDPNKKFFTWLYRLTVNAAIDYLRSKRRRSREHSLDEKPDSYDNIPSSDNDAVAAGFERQELRQLFFKLASELNPKQQAAFMLCDLQGFTADEVAEILACPKVTLRWYLHEARKHIRQTIADQHPEYFRGRRPARKKTALNTHNNQRGKTVEKVS